MVRLQCPHLALAAPAPAPAPVIAICPIDQCSAEPQLEVCSAVHSSSLCPLAAFTGGGGGGGMVAHLLARQLVVVGVLFAWCSRPGSEASELMCSAKGECDAPDFNPAEKSEHFE